jgi:5-methylcytosine-specific restriction endonuclease McrA
MKTNEDGLTVQQVIQRKIADKHASYERENKVTSLCDLSKRTITKILKRMELPCSNCGWYVKGVVGDLHHIVERKNSGGDEHTNLTYVCPNCHRLIHSKIIKSNELINLDDYIGDKWKDYYYVKNGKLEEK